MVQAKPDIRRIFSEALDRESAAEVAEFLEAACGANVKLRSEVEALLALHEERDNFLGGPQSALRPTVDQPALTEAPGTLIGPYKLREQIGEGGFGVVYVAEQEKPVARKVALKIIKPGMDTKEVVARFEAERQALALMDHPNIAKVLDAGATESGRPYFVMELVKGVSITEFCDEQTFSTRERLELFVDVCRAVQHAHQKGVIHRDLKPSNVMVTLDDDRPVPKVIDFGVSKALSKKLTDKSIYTAYGQMVGTPLYMAPEQAQMTMRDVDTRSDVYSLGVLLYELLTGTTPFDKETLKNAGFDELRRIISEDTPPRPSDRVSTLNAEALSTVSVKRKVDPHKIGPSFRGELDWIVMKALEKDRNRRYESASAFAEDAGRYLNDEPVQACPPSMWYRFSKFARRQKVVLAVVVVALAFLATVAGGIGWTISDQAARQTRLTLQVDLILDDVDQLMKQQKWPEALTVAKRGETLIAGAEADAESQRRMHNVLADLKLVQRLEHVHLRDSQITDGTFDQSGAEQAYSQAFAMADLKVEGVTLEQAARQLRARSRIVTELASALTNWARLRRILKKRTNETSWQHLLAVADEIDPDQWRRRLRKEWGTPKVVNAKTIRELADSADLRKLPPSTIVLLGRLVRESVSPEDAVEVLQRAQPHHAGDFWINSDLAGCFEDSTPKRLDEAIAFYRVAHVLRPRSIAVFNKLGNVLLKKGKLDEAIACYSKALKLDAKYFAVHHNLGVALFEKGNLDEAVASYRKAIELNPKSATSYSNLGNALKGNGNIDEAIVCCKKAIELAPKYAPAHFNLGNALEEKQKLDEAIACYKTAIELAPELPLPHYNLGHALVRKRKFDEAIASFKTTIEIDAKYAPAHYNLGIALVAQGRLDEAIKSYSNAITLKPEKSEAHNNLGNALASRGKPDEAIKCYRNALKLKPDGGMYHYNLAHTLHRQGKLDEAIKCYREAITHIPDYFAAYNNLGIALKNQGKLDEAIKCCRECIRLKPDDSTAHYRLGDILRKQERLDDAIKCYRIVIRLKPDHVAANQNLAWYLCTADPKLGNPTEALASANVYVKARPNSANAWWVLGLARYRAGEWKDSVDAIHRACELNKHAGSPAYLLVRSMAHWKVGQKPQAREWYNKAVKRLDKGKPDKQNPHGLRAEAEAVLGITEAERRAIIDEPTEECGRS